VSRDWRLYADDIIEYGRHVQQFTEGVTFESFVSDDKTQLAVLRCLEIIGEAVKQMPPAELAQHPDVPWRRVARFRDRVAHGYFGIKLEIVWEIIHDHLPHLLAAVERSLGTHQADDAP